MAKKIVFLLVFLLVLVWASVTSFATGTTSTTDASPMLTDDKNAVSAVPEITENRLDYEKEYSDVFFDSDSKTEEFLLNILIKRVYSTNNQLRHRVSGTVVQSDEALENPEENVIVMMMYIKAGDQYVPLNKAEVTVGEDGKANVVEGSIVLAANVDLLNLGSDKTNEIRMVVFKKGDEKLELGKNLQITDMDITVNKLTVIERLKIEFNQFTNSVLPQS